MDISYPYITTDKDAGRHVFESWLGHDFFIVISEICVESRLKLFACFYHWGNLSERKELTYEPYVKLNWCKQKKVKGSNLIRSWYKSIFSDYQQSFTKEPEQRCKWSPTANDPQTGNDPRCGPQMIPPENEELNGMEFVPRVENSITTQYNTILYSNDKKIKKQNKTLLERGNREVGPM